MKPADPLTHSIIHDCTDAIVVNTLGGSIFSWNKAAEMLFGYAEADALERNTLMLVPADRAEEEADILARVSSGEQVSPVHTVRIHRSGQRFAAVITVSPVRDRAGNIIGVSNIVRPTDNSPRSERDLLTLAYHDPLTSLSNRVHLLDRLEQAMRRNERTRHYGAVYFIDLDNFKAVNDTYGHQMGDRVLLKCARRMEAALREYDTIARWGGDEFVIMTEDLDPNFQNAMDRAHAIARKLLRVLRKTYVLDGCQFSCPPSIGVACFRGVTDPVTQAIESADRAMYRSKMAGKNCIHVDGEKPRDAVDIARPVPAVA